MPLIKKITIKNSVILQLQTDTFNFSDLIDFEYDLVNEIADIKKNFRILIDLNNLSNVPSSIVSILLKIFRVYQKDYKIKVLANEKAYRIFSILNIITLLNVELREKI